MELDSTFKSGLGYERKECSGLEYKRPEDDMNEVRELAALGSLEELAAASNGHYGDAHTPSCNF